MNRHVLDHPDDHKLAVRLKYSGRLDHHTGVYIACQDCGRTWRTRYDWLAVAAFVAAMLPRYGAFIGAEGLAGSVLDVVIGLAIGLLAFLAIEGVLYLLLRRSPCLQKHCSNPVIVRVQPKESDGSGSHLIKSDTLNSLGHRKEHHLRVRQRWLSTIIVCEDCGASWHSKYEAAWMYPPVLLTVILAVIFLSELYGRNALDNLILTVLCFSIPYTLLAAVFNCLQAAFLRSRADLSDHLGDHL